jgi:hypothetical protein
MPNIFDQADIRFIFPDNWKVIDSHLESQHRRSISLENESSVQWSVYIYSGSENLDELVAYGV